MTHRQGEIVLVPFPFSDLSSSKKRPALVISNDEYNLKSQDLVICGMTSKTGQQDYSVIVSQKDLFSGRLLATSRIKVDKLFTIKKSRVIKSLGTISDDSLNRVKDEMLKLFQF
jgi:mRNA interferase MazF